MIPIWKLSGRLGNQMFQFAYLKAEELDGNIPDVYVQDEVFFEKHKETIKAMYGQDIVPIDQVAIHVRRTDYVDNPFYFDLFKDGYYERAMAEFPGEEFVVFSDDIEWCKQQPIFKGCEFSEGNSEIEDMNYMAGCKGIIIANSSFSWWAAYLGDDNKKVVAPLEWYTLKADGDNNVKTPYTGLPEKWKRI